MLFVAIFFLGCVLSANDRRRPRLKFNDWFNDWPLRFNDWFQEGVSVNAGDEDKKTKHYLATLSQEGPRIGRKMRPIATY